MFSLAAIIVTASALFQATQALPYPFNEVRADTTYLYPRDHLYPREVEVVKELGPQLSRNATIITSSDPQWANVTERWSTFVSPHFRVVVEPGVESDVAKIVRYANRRSIPFWATNRGHSTVLAAGTMDGIGIRMSTLDGLSLNKDRASAHMQGGIYVAQVMERLWDLGYVTTTGSCNCVGLMGPALGGGMGRYEGFYGLVSDNILSMNVVLADGSEVVVSPSSPDLWWAMRGAGHNFGIVTSFDLKIYPKTTDWWYGTYLYSGDKLENVVKAANSLSANGAMRKELGYFGIMTIIPPVDPVNPSLSWTIWYAGSQQDAAPYVKPFLDIGPRIVQNGSVPFPQLPDAVGSGLNTPLCKPGRARFERPAGLQNINVTASRLAYNSLRDFVKTNPAAYSSCGVLYEGYSVLGVRNRRADDSAYPHRDDILLADASADYNTDPSLDAAANQWTKAAVKILNDGQPDRKPTSYVNYALGDEPLEQIYGYEPWRLERLRELKKKYDPSNKFRYYIPIIRS